MADSYRPTDAIHGTCPARPSTGVHVAEMLEEGTLPVAGVEVLTDTLDAVARPVHGEVEDAITGESATTLHDISYLTDGRPFDGRRVVVPISGVAP